MPSLRHILAASLLSLSTFSWAGPVAPTPITLSFNGVDTWSASFSALSSGTNSFLLDLSPFAGMQLGTLSALVSANFLGSSGYDISSVSIGGQAFKPLIDQSIPGLGGIDLWSFNTQSWSTVPQLIEITGQLLGGTTGFIGSVSVVAKPVPEPASYALLLLGLAGIAWVRRQRQPANYGRLVHLPQPSVLR
ncbi:FxDxF family PEP-CTERM protein [Paucibacter sp. AS339]|uniref:FxDxF family PEP-CTERM protein n=1 Tax=Paucibacter hankyongi TaxID=3133434 RepID=UPI00309F301A